MNVSIVNPVTTRIIANVHFVIQLQINPAKHIVL